MQEVRLPNLASSSLPTPSTFQFSKMNLQDLPEDILTYFLASLVSEGANQSSQAAPDLHTDLKTLFALTLTNAKLYKMSNPVLFSEIPLTAARLGWFLELFSKREELRGHVKKVVSGTNGNIKGNFSPSQVSMSNQMTPCSETDQS